MLLPECGWVGGRGLVLDIYNFSSKVDQETFCCHSFQLWVLGKVGSWWMLQSVQTAAGWAGRCGLIAQPAVTMAWAGGQRCTAVIYYPQSADQIPGMMQPGPRNYHNTAA